MLIPFSSYPSLIYWANENLCHSDHSAVLRKSLVLTFVTKVICLAITELEKCQQLLNPEHLIRQNSLEQET